MPLSPLDTFDYEPVEIDLGNLLSSGETISSATVVVPATAAAAGVLVDTTINPIAVVPGYSTEKALAGVTFWLLCDVLDQEDDAFSPKLDANIGIRLVLNTGRKLERHLLVTFQREITLTEV